MIFPWTKIARKGIFLPATLDDSERTGMVRKNHPEISRISDFQRYSDFSWKILYSIYSTHVGDSYLCFFLG